MDNKEDVKTTESNTNVNNVESNSKEESISPQVKEESANIFGLPEEKEEQPEEEKVIPKEESQKVEPQNEEVPEITPELNGEEKVVYEYKPPKEYGIWPYLIFFIFVGSVIIFLPTIQKFITDYKNNKIVIEGNEGNTNLNPNNQNEEEQEEIVYYDFNDQTTISINKITLNNFSKSFENGSYYVSTIVINKNNAVYNFDDNIYIELYNDNETLLSRSILESDTPINASSSSLVKLLINEKAYSEVTKLVVRNIKSENYTKIELEENLKDQETLNCTLNNRKLVYTFSDYKLLSIDDTLDVLKTSYTDLSIYASDLATYRQTSAQRGLISGVSSSIVDAEDGFTLATKIDSSSISDTDLTSLNERAYYKKDTDAKIVSFEMIARGYTCK